MKKSLIKIIALVLVLSQLMVMSALAFTSEETYLTNEQKEVIYEQIEEINNKYEIGEPFSKEDQVFIERYAPLINKKNVATDVEEDIYAYKTSNDGYVTAVIAGVVFADIGVFNHSFGARYTTVVNDGEEYLEEIEARVNCVAYGVIGSDGAIGKIYDNTLTATSDEFVLDFDQTEAFTGAVLYGVVTVKSVITYQYGSFTINGF